MSRFIAISAILFLISHPLSATTDEYNETLKNNEASGYVNMLESFIDKATEQCKTLLDQDDNWRERLVNNWKDTNKEYTQAVRLWTDQYITEISLHYGESMAQYEEQKIKSVIHMRGTNITKEIIRGDTAEKTAACTDFENRLVSGQLNVSDESPHFSHLQQMVDLYR